MMKRFTIRIDQEKHDKLSSICKEHDINLNLLTNFLYDDVINNKDYRFGIIRRGMSQSDQEKDMANEQQKAYLAKIGMQVRDVGP